MRWRTRPATSADLPFLRRMLFEAAYWRYDVVAQPSFTQGIQRPDLVPLLDEGGQGNDCGLIAVSEAGAPLGAVWYRFWTDADHSYGFVAADIPEMALGVEAAVRRHGLGTALVGEMLATAADRGVPGISLSVEPANPSRIIYERAGFEKVGEVGGAWTMLYRCDTAPMR